MSSLIKWFIKVTGVIPELIYFKKKIYYVNKKKQSRKIKKAAIIISNHHAVMDYGLQMFTFYSRNLYTLAGEVLYKKSKIFTWFLKQIGAIKVDRDSYNFGFMNDALKVLKKNKVLSIFPEGRLRRSGEEKMLPFKPSFVYLALESGAPIIPMYSDGGFKNRKRTNVIIGEPINLSDLYDCSLDEKTNIDYLCQYVYNYILNLGDELNGKAKAKQK